MSGPVFTPAQEQAIRAPGSVAIAAGAGSGKTRVLAERTIHLLEQGVSPGEIAAVTFTEAAAGELRSRITRFLENRVHEDAGRWAGVAAELPAMQVGTIHALCSRVAREHPVESGAGLAYEVLVPVEARAWLDEHLESVLSELPEEVLRAVPGRIRREVLEALLDDPVAAEQALDVAGARASLPPRERAERAWAVVQAQWDAQVAQLAAVAGPSTDDVERLRQGALQLAGASPLFGDDLRVLRTVLASHRPNTGKGWDRAARGQVHAALKWLKGAAARDDLLGEATPESARHDAAVLALRTTFSHLRDRLAQLKALEGVATFADLEVFARRALSYEHVRAYYAGRWRHLMIDEAQDTNPVQWDVLRALIGADVNVTVVGDEKQGIYGFRRADVQVFRSARALVEERGGQVVAMHTSFRTHARLVGVLNAYFEVLMSGPDETRPTAATFEALIAHRSDAPFDGPAVELHAVQGEGNLRRAEADYLAQRIQALVLGGHPVYDREEGRVRPLRLGDVAVLFRARTDVKEYEAALVRAGLPYQLHGGAGLLGRPEVMDACELLLTVADPHRDVSFAAVLRGPYAQLSDEALLTLARLRQDGESLWDAAQRSDASRVIEAVTLIRDLQRASATASASALLTEADRRTDLRVVHAALPDGERRNANLARFHAMLRAWAQGGVRDLAGVAQRLARYERLGADEAEGSSASPQAVQLMTIHGSKGLEFPVVVYADVLRQGGGTPPPVAFDSAHGLALLLPGQEIKSAEWAELEALSSERDASEDERVAYVAFTRAADLLILSATSRGEGRTLERAARLMATLPEDGVSRTYIDPAMVDAPEKLDLEFTPSGPILPVRAGPGTLLPGSLAVTSIATYLACPRQFAYRHVEGRVPLAALWSEQQELARLNPQGRAAGRQIGDAVHQAFEHGWRGEALLEKVAYLAPSDQQDVLRFVQAFQGPAFASVNARTYQREQPIQVPVGGLLFEGVVDAYDAEGRLVLDYKTDRSVQPEHHLPQLAVYARHLGAEEAALAYLRHDHLHVFSPEDLARGFTAAQEAAQHMEQRNFDPTPAPQTCRWCEFRGVCDAAVSA